MKLQLLADTSEPLSKLAATATIRDIGDGSRYLEITVQPRQKSVIMDFVKKASGLDDKTLDTKFALPWRLDLFDYSNDIKPPEEPKPEKEKKPKKEEPDFIEDWEPYSVIVDDAPAIARTATPATAGKLPALRRCLLPRLLPLQPEKPHMPGKKTFLG